ncbi:hypothetical protein [Streptomyces sp. NPDC096323]|uniref:hypothetical protein n=1 Tax=Streptomyces sp. NPDC096323 TaxID=3155822 RepID=UPI00332F5ABC
MTLRRSGRVAATLALGAAVLLGATTASASAAPHLTGNGNGMGTGTAYADDPAPAAPAGLQVLYDPETETAAVSWNASTEEDLAGYRLYRRLVEDSDWTLVSGAEPLTATATTDFLPSTGDVYAYSVRAVDRAGHESEPGGDDWYLETPDASPPSVPADLNAQGTTAGNTVRWRASSDHVDHYEVWAAPEGQEDQDGPASVYGAGFTDSQAAQGVRVTYTVEAVDASGQRSGLSAPVTASRPAPGTAPRPTGVMTQVSGDHVTISWDAHSGDMGQSYRVYGHSYPGPAAWSLLTTVYPHGGMAGVPVHSGPFYVVSVDDEGRESAPVYAYAT